MFLTNYLSIGEMNTEQSIWGKQFFSKVKADKSNVSNLHQRLPISVSIFTIGSSNDWPSLFIYYRRLILNMIIPISICVCLRTFSSVDSQIQFVKSLFYNIIAFNMYVFKRRPWRFDGSSINKNHNTCHVNVYSSWKMWTSFRYGFWWPLRGLPVACWITDN